MSKNNQDDTVGIIIITCIITIAFVMAIFGCMTTYTDSKIVDVYAFGNKLCNEYNLSYDHVEFNDETNMHVPTFYCKAEEVKLVDGIVKKI